MCSIMIRIYKIGSEILGFPPPQKKNWQSKNIEILVQFWTTSQLDYEYPQTGRRYRQLENSVTKCDHSHICILN